MSGEMLEQFCERMRERLGAGECRSFAGRFESIAALCQATELGSGDCVYVTPLASTELVRSLIFCGVTPIFCDVVPNTLTMDHRSLEKMVNANGNLYPRAAIVEHFGGMPFAAKAIKNACDRLGLILVEDCGEGFGGSSDGTLCGAIGDYALISLGRSSAFGTGGSGCLVTAAEGNPFGEKLVSCDGEEYRCADEQYGSTLCEAFEHTDEAVEKSRQAAAEIADALADTDTWMQHGGSKQKSSCGKVTLILPDAACCVQALQSFAAAGLAQYVKPIHAHKKGCFEIVCHGLKEAENASSLAPRALQLNLFGALHDGALERLTAYIPQIAAWQ